MGLSSCPVSPEDPVHRASHMNPNPDQRYKELGGWAGKKWKLRPTVPGRWLCRDLASWELLGLAPSVMVMAGQPPAETHRPLLSALLHRATA